MGKNRHERAQDGHDEFHFRARQSHDDFERGARQSHSSYVNGSESQLGSGGSQSKEPEQAAGGTLELLTMTLTGLGALAITAAAGRDILRRSR